MGQNDLEKLLCRVLNELDYKKVKSFLDNEAGDLLQQQEFVIRNGLPPQHPNHQGGSHQDQIMLSSANNHFSAGSNGSQQ